MDRARVVIAVAIGLFSCKNNDNVFPKKVITQINVVNASADTLNFFLNGTRQNNTSSLFPTGQSFYLFVPPGLQNYQFKKQGATTVLFNVPVTLGDTAHTSLYIYGETTAQTFTSNDPLFFVTGHPDTTQIRFVNVSPDAGNINVTVGTTVSFTSTRLVRGCSAYSMMTS